MPTQVTAYAADDGTLFLTQREASKQENMLAKKAMIMEFLASPENTLQTAVRHEPRLIEFISNWEQWQKDH